MTQAAAPLSSLCTLVQDTHSKSPITIHTRRKVENIYSLTLVAYSAPWRSPILCLPQARTVKSYVHFLFGPFDAGLMEFYCTYFYQVLLSIYLPGFLEV